uniref:Uncharacterized protein n=1 Tax=Caenorhabditis japonica TaxID=281687 RepID=A0A8R1J0Y7_CAEJA
MYPKINDKKLPKQVKEAITIESAASHKFSSFNRNEPCSLPVICEMIAAFADKDPAEVARITTENAKRVYDLN